MSSLIPGRMYTLSSTQPSFRSLIEPVGGDPGTDNIIKGTPVMFLVDECERDAVYHRVLTPFGVRWLSDFTGFRFIEWGASGSLLG